VPNTASIVAADEEEDEEAGAKNNTRIGQTKPTEWAASCGNRRNRIDRGCYIISYSALQS
jgi:hypothetical protein